VIWDRGGQRRYDDWKPQIRKERQKYQAKFQDVPIGWMFTYVRKKEKARKDMTLRNSTPRNNYRNKYPFFSLI
jgi:hypothetical protein